MKMISILNHVLMDTPWIRMEYVSNALKDVSYAKIILNIKFAPYVNNNHFNTILYLVTI